jgi:hypothetical protein
MPFPPMIACTPVNLPDDAPAYPNTHYEQVECPLCHALMYLGPRSKLAHQRDGIAIACMACVLAIAKLAGTDIAMGHLGGP